MLYYQSNMKRAANNIGNYQESRRLIYHDQVHQLKLASYLVNANDNNSFSAFPADIPNRKKPYDKAGNPQIIVNNISVLYTNNSKLSLQRSLECLINQ